MGNKKIVLIQFLTVKNYKKVKEIFKVVLWWVYKKVKISKTFTNLITVETTEINKIFISIVIFLMKDF